MPFVTLLLFLLFVVVVVGLFACFIPRQITQPEVAFIIGRSGMTVNKLMKESKTTVVLKERVKGSAWSILISGPPKNIAVGVDIGVNAVFFFLLCSFLSPF